MGNGTSQRKNYNAPQRGYFSVKGHDVKYGGDYRFIVLPLYGADDERFFFVRELDNGEYDVTGEGYVVMRPTRLSEYFGSDLKELVGVPVWYYFLDQEGRVIRKERGGVVS
jgi:hypothetical protein